MKVLLLTRYGPLGASSRVRSLQYLPYFQAQGIQVAVRPLFSDGYLQALYTGGARWHMLFWGYLRRFVGLFDVLNFDAVIIEKELFPFMPAIAERILQLIGVRYVVDYDDALFHRYDCHSNPLVRKVLGKKIDSVMRNATTVITGNSYLAERALSAGAIRVEIIPTVVDTKLYQPRQQENSGPPTIGWIGTPQTSRYLMQLLPVFESIKNEFSVRFVAVGARNEDFENTLVEVWSWSEETEVKSIQQFDIGIMPLQDSPWERGKCGYKLIQYMACGVPVVASPVGVNIEIVNSQKIGLLADSPLEWEKALRSLLEANASMRKKMGEAGRARVEKKYSLHALAPRLLSVISDACSSTK